MSANAVERLLDHTFETHYEQLVPATVRSLHIFIQDSLGVGICGSRVPFSQRLIELNQSWGSLPEARILCSGDALSAPAAAMVNAWQIHNQEYDCVHEAAVVHPMAVILAAVLAYCERRGGVDGREFLVAISTAVDIATLLGSAATSALTFFRPGICGALGATLAMARLGNLTREQARNALGIAYSQLGGTMQAHVEGKPMLAMQVATNARNAVQSVDMAAAGLEAPQDVIEGPFGFFSLFEKTDQLSETLDQLGSTGQITHVSHKPFPTGRACHGGLEALQILQQTHGFTAAEIDGVTLTAPPLIKRLIGRTSHDDMPVSYARLCFQYTGASLLMDGRVAVDCYDSDKLYNPERLALAARLRVVEDGSEDPNAMSPQTLTLTLSDGRTFEHHVPATLGSPQRPLTGEQHLQKMRQCCRDGLTPMQEAQIEHLVAITSAIQDLADVRQLMDASVA